MKGVHASHFAAPRVSERDRTSTQAQAQAQGYPALCEVLVFDHQQSELSCNALQPLRLHFKRAVVLRPAIKLRLGHLHSGIELTISMLDR